MRNIRTTAVSAQQSFVRPQTFDYTRTGELVGAWNSKHFGCEIRCDVIWGPFGLRERTVKATEQRCAFETKSSIKCHVPLSLVTPYTGAHTWIEMSHLIQCRKMTTTEFSRFPSGSDWSNTVKGNCLLKFNSVHKIDISPSDGSIRGESSIQRLLGFCASNQQVWECWPLACVYAKLKTRFY